MFLNADSHGSFSCRITSMYALSSHLTARCGTQEDDSVFTAAVKKELTSALKGKAEGSVLALADAARDAEAFRRCASISMRSQRAAAMALPACASWLLPDSCACRLKQT